MPELPDVIVYCEALTAHAVGRRLTHVRVTSPFVLRSFDPPIDVLDGQVLRTVSRVGKRIVLGFDGELRLVVHLMIAGRLRWRQPAHKLGMGPRMVLAALEFEHGTLYFTEAGSTKRASLHLVRGDDAIQAMDRGGIEPLSATAEGFAEALRRENHTLKRSLTDPRLFSGIGNAYSDEILHAARLSPMKLSQSLTDAQILALREATKQTLTAWTARLRAETGAGFPEKVTAFHDGMAVHGRFGKPCPTCGAPVQRIVYAENECNYCAICQTEGRLLADRALSRLLRDDWPKRLEEW